MLRRLKANAQGLLARAIRETPIASTHLGPPKGIILDFRTWAEECDRAQPFVERGWRHWQIPVREAEVVQSRSPLTLDSTMPLPYREAQLYRYPPLFLAHLRLGRLALSEGVVISPTDQVFDEFSYDWGRTGFQRRIFRRLRLPPMEHREGIFATLLSPGSASPNYYHWLIETLPRVGILEEAGLKDYRLIVPQILASWQSEALDRLGLGPERRVGFGEQHWQIDSLLVPSLPGYPGMCRPWAANWLRRRLGVPEGVKATRRLYVSRSGATQRRVSNEQEVVAALAPLGFETISTEDMRLEEQIFLFSQAQFIVGLHGAGLTNVLFAPREARVLEFMSPVPGYVNACYYSLSAAVGLRYMYLMGSHLTAPADFATGTRRWREDLQIPIPALVRSISVLEAAT